MSFPRTTVGGLSLSRMIIGTNWFMGFSHCTAAKDQYIKDHIMNRSVIADILEVFVKSGIDTIMGQIQAPALADAVKETENRTGKKIVVVSTPSLPTTPRTALDGFDLDAVAPILDQEAAHGAAFCMPHTSTTDMMVDLCSREVRQMAPVCKLIRERGMIPGLSTHRPETIVYADETELDVETYVCIYNTAGFLMPLEVDWTLSVIRGARKPVMTIKPMAAGQLRPLQAMNFVWNTLRPQDMVTAGTMSPEEARELIDLSLQILECQESSVRLQETRSKASVKNVGGRSAQ